MCLNETYSKVHIGKHLSDSFPIQNGLKQGDALSPMLFNFALEYAVRKVVPLVKEVIKQRSTIYQNKIEGHVNVLI
jgi:hypothetical protein